MKFLASRRDFERDGYDSRSGSKRAMGMYQESPEPIPTQVAVLPPRPEAPKAITAQTPDNVIGETLVLTGRIEFQNLLRIDGRFEGDIVGSGSLIIGPTAEVVSNLKDLDEVYVEGVLIGDCSCDKMQIRFGGCVTGNLHCASLGMDPSVVLKGSANVSPRDKEAKSKTKHHSSRGHRQRPQGRGASDENSSSSRTSHASTSVLSPESVRSRAPIFDDDNNSVDADSGRMSINHDDTSGKASNRPHASKSKSSRASRGGSTQGSSATGADGGVEKDHKRGNSAESTSSFASTPGEDKLKTVPRMGDTVVIPVRGSKPPTHGVKAPQTMREE